MRICKMTTVLQEIMLCIVNSNSTRWSVVRCVYVKWYYINTWKIVEKIHSDTNKTTSYSHSLYYYFVLEMDINGKSLLGRRIIFDFPAFSIYFCVFLSVLILIDARCSDDSCDSCSDDCDSCSSSQSSEEECPCSCKI